MQMTRCSVVGLLLVLASLTPVQAAKQANAHPRLALKQPAQIEPAPQQAGRFQIKARFAAEESAGELRESGRFSLIGLLAKAGGSCDFSQLFGDGFEGN